MSHENEQVTARSLLLAALRHRRGRIAALILIALGAAGVDIAAPFLIGVSINAISAPGGVQTSLLIGRLAALAALYAVGAVLRYTLSVLTTKTAYHVVADLRLRCFEHLSRLPLRYFDATPRGDIQSRFINDAEALADGLIGAALQLFSGLFTAVGVLIFMLLLSPAVTLAVVSVTALSFVVANLVTRFTARYFRETQQKLGAMSANAEQTAALLETIQAYGDQPRAKERFDRINRELHRASLLSQFGGSLSNPTTRFIGHIAYIAVGVVGGALVGLPVGAIGSFAIYATQFTRPFNEITGVWNNILSARAGLERMIETLNTPAEANDNMAAELADVRGDIAFEGVFFAYHPSRPLIENFDLRVSAGRHVAIVGPTGAGKTTLINLIMRFYETDSGRITLDGQDIRTLQRDSLRRQFAMVLQDTWLFEGSITDNIAYGTGANRERVEEVLRAVHADGFVARLPQGADTVLDSSVSLSAGQRQLLTIARAMLLNPPMLILDEALSSVDTLIERQVAAAFDQLMAGKTSFIIAHRLSTIKNADLILVMQNGRVAEQGTHTELLARRGLYHELYSSQFDEENRSE